LRGEGEVKGVGGPGELATDNDYFPLPSSGSFSKDNPFIMTLIFPITQRLGGLRGMLQNWGTGLMLNRKEQVCARAGKGIANSV